MDHRYLLLSGKRRAGRVRTTVSVYATAGEANAEFGRRRKRLGVGAWLELASIDDQGRMTAMCRSGDQPPAAPHAATMRSASMGSAPMWTCT
jgi:hypothetical protein